MADFISAATAALDAAPHVIILPFPQKSHINPMMNLAQYLASRQVHVTFVYYGRPASVEMETKIVEHVAQFSGSQYLRVIVAGAGAGARLSEEHPSERGVNELLLKESLSAMEKEIESLLQESANASEHPATCLVCDTLYGTWPHDVAKKFGIPLADFSTFTATNYMLCAKLPRGYIVPDARSGQPADDVERILSSFVPGVAPSLRVKDLPSSIFRQAGKPTPDDRRFDVHLEDSVRAAYGRGRGAKWVLLHTCYELEKSVIDILQADKVSVYAIGPLLPPSAMSALGKSSSGQSSVLQPEHGDGCLRWLDTQRGPSSVLFIALGTTGSWSPAQIQVLAQGIEESQVPFIWDLRPNMLIEGITSSVSVMDMLPKGFLARTKDRSLVVSRAPQLAILAHPSTGGFLTQCEWNCIQEGIHYGVPMIGIGGCFAEQPTNMRLMTHEWKVGIGIEACDIQRDDVTRAVRAVMSQTGEERKRVREAMSVVQHCRSVGSSKSNLNAFVEDLWNIAKSTSETH